MEIVTKQEIKDMIKSGELIKIPHQNHKPAKNPPELSISVYPITMEYDFSPYLIKIDNHYVPAGYLFYGDTGQEKDRYRDDINAALPTLEFDKGSEKYKLEFAGADSGGYDATIFEWYFDSIEDLMKELQGE